MKSQIQMAYLHGENNNQEAIEKVNKTIIELIETSPLITVTENDEHVKIPYGNDGEFIIPIFTDKQELEKGLEYFRLNEMSENKVPKIVEIDYFKKIRDNPNFLGLLINIATVSYIISLNY
ncbi:hypothetical protein [Methanobrevibacter sp.]|uniref:hypothetical protein n=1 Tax=Methanobrevibacter sp. TaxID=66852 RepID=UPI0026DEAA05|nr:hypothetical protein [Methanobrevibacter sp.]